MWSQKGNLQVAFLGEQIGRTLKFLVPGFAKSADEWLTKVLVEWQTALASQPAGTETDVPAIVVEADKTSCKALLTYRVKRTADRLGNGDLALHLCLLYGAEADALVIVAGEDTIFAVYDAGDSLAVSVKIACALLINDLQSLWREVGP